MKPSEFYRELSKANNYMPEDTLKAFYQSLVRVITRELHDNGEITLPEFGRFWLGDYKARRMTDIRSQNTIMLGERKVLRFRPTDNIKKYFNY